MAKKMTFAADKIERRKVGDLRPYARNPKTHPPSQITALVGMIKEFGFTEPLLIDEDDTILAGHGRTLAAKEIGFEELPVVVIRGLTDSQKRALVIADNRSNEMGGWNNELLVSELNELKLSGYSIELTGFDSSDLVSFIAQASEQDATRQQNVGNLAERFGIPPFSILNAREGWWQDRKRAWLSIGIQSELGRGAPTGGSAEPLAQLNAGDQSVMGQNRKANASPGGSPRPAADYSRKERGDGSGKSIRRKPNAIPGGGTDAARPRKSNARKG